MAKVSEMIDRVVAGDIKVVNENTTAKKMIESEVSKQEGRMPSGAAEYFETPEKYYFNSPEVVAGIEDFLGAPFRDLLYIGHESLPTDTDNRFYDVTLSFNAWFEDEFNFKTVKELPNQGDSIVGGTYKGIPIVYDHNWGADGFFILARDLGKL